MIDDVFIKMVDFLEPLENNEKSFRFNRQNALLIYPIKITLIKDFLSEKLKNIEDIYVIYDNSKTYVLFTLKKKIDSKNSTFLDYSFVHPIFFKVKNWEKIVVMFEKTMNYVVTENFINGTKFNNKLTFMMESLELEDSICLLIPDTTRNFRFQFQKTFLVYKTLINRTELNDFLDNITKTPLKKCYISHVNTDKLMSHEHTNVLIDWGKRIDRKDVNFLDYNNIHPVIFQVRNLNEWKRLCVYISKSDLSLKLSEEDIPKMTEIYKPVKFLFSLDPRTYSKTKKTLQEFCISDSSEEEEDLKLCYKNVTMSLSIQRKNMKN